MTSIMHTLPPIPSLKGESNFKIWKRSILLELSYLDLKGHLDGTVTKPDENDAAAMQEYKKGRTHAMIIIIASIHHVFELLESAGMKDEEEDPKVLSGISSSPPFPD
ncbi:hypothetical protein M426DRAFT_12767 [Hypoxylon sp. CI-4A]|nr:hypothetical protein M426DRAFT_12767 [Hypoxylon sp. CI-4A]